MMNKKTNGQKCTELFESSDLEQSSPRMSRKGLYIEHAKISDTVRCYEYPPPQWVRRIVGRDSGYLPTPTAKANIDAPYMRRWPAYRAYQEWINGITSPILWEWLMGYPEGWTDLEGSGMQLSLKSQQ